MQVAIITGASRGLGLALATELADRGWALVIDARGADALGAAEAELAPDTTVRSIPGRRHRPGPPACARRPPPASSAASMPSSTTPAFSARARSPSFADYPLDVLRQVYEVNVVAPLALVQEALPALRPGARIVNITSDAAVEAYEGWGGYGSSKAALEQLTAVLGAEHPDLRVYRVDPGDLRTQMHQEAFPGEDISDRPLPEVAVPGLVELLEGDEPSGRYRAQELVPA